MRKITLLSCLLLAGCAIVLTVLASGTAADPLVTVSYVRQLYNTAVEQDAGTRADALVSQKTDALQSAIESAVADRIAQGLATSVAQSVGQSAGTAAGRSWTEVTLSQGDVVSGPVGAGIMLTAGSAATTGTSELIDVTNGRTLSIGVVASPNTYYMVPTDQSAGLRVTSTTATVRVRDGAAVTRAQTALYEDEADRLNAIGLFRGSNYGYELTRRPTRQESLIMLIRLLGEEQAALAYTGQSTFTDLTGWPDGIRYVAYGQHMGYTNGMTATEFSQQTPADATMYCTYVLRALGYDDAAGDFSYREAVQKAIEVGLLTSAQYEQLQTTGLLRDHMVLISYNALWAACNGSDQTLGERLVERGVLTQAQLDSARK